MKGTVKWFSGKKGYGFVEGEDGQDYFVHKNAVKEGTFLNEDDEVTFEPAETDKGLQAQNVEKTGESGSEDDFGGFEDEDDDEEEF